MFRNLMIAAASMALLGAGAAPAFAGNCSDAHGKFITCPKKAAPAKSTRCKDAKGKFAKCGTKGAKPA